MSKILTLIFGVVVVWSIASCQADEVALPTPMPEPTSSSTPKPKANPTPTNIVGTSTTEPLCFAPVDLNPIAFTPDNAMLVIKGSTEVQIFNLKTMKEEKFLQASQNLTAAALSPDGRTLAWALEDFTIQLVQVSDGKILNSMPGHANLITKLLFSPDGDKLFSASADGHVRIWDTQGEPLEDLVVGPEVEGLGISPDGTQLATVPFDGPVELWDLSENRKITALGGTGGFITSDAVFSPDGKYLAADLASGLFLWQLSDGKSLWDDLKNSMAITYSPDGRFLAYALIADDSQIILSSPDGAQIIHTLEGMQGPVWGLIFSPDSSMLAATSDNEIRIWQVEDGRFLYIGKPAC
jgi:WD40 repeat protein